jgi:hypothetical protein
MAKTVSYYLSGEYVPIVSTEVLNPPSGQKSQPDHYPREDEKDD